MHCRDVFWRLCGSRVLLVYGTPHGRSTGASSAITELTPVSEISHSIFYLPSDLYLGRQGLSPFMLRGCRGLVHQHALLCGVLLWKTDAQAYTLYGSRTHLNGLLVNVTTRSTITLFSPLPIRMKSTTHVHTGHQIMDTGQGEIRSDSAGMQGAQTSVR
jgi:hypothetical protein